MTKGVTAFKFVAALVSLVVLMGCEGREKERGDLEAADAKILSKLSSDITIVKKNLSYFNKELHAVRSAQEELEDRMIQMAEDRDETKDTTKSTEQRIEELAAQINEQVEVLSQFENEVKELNVAIENQQTTINELQTTVAELVNIIEQQAAAEEQQEEVVEYQEQEEEY